MTQTARATSTARRRAEILAAALACFDERGVAATTIADVRARSGASTGSIYHHFGSKQELAGALYVEGLGEYHRQALAVVREHPGAEEGIGALVRNHLAWIASEPALARYLLTSREPEVRRATRGPLRELNRGFMREMGEWIDGHVAAGRLRPLPVTLLYVIVLGPSHELARLWLAGRVREPIEDAAEALADAAWAAVRAEGGSR